MIKIFSFLIIIFLVVVIQSSLYPYLKINNAFPNLILIVVITLSILQRQKENIIWIIFGGLCLDIFSFSNPLGLSIVGLFLASYSTFIIKQYIFQKISPSSIALIGISGVLSYKFFVLLFLKLASFDTSLSIGQTITESIYSLIFLIPLFYLFSHFYKNKKTAIF